MKKITFAGIIIAALSLTGCGGEGGGNASMPPATGAAALATLDQNGSLPILNRDNTVTGPDINANGVRDDIDAYIASLPDSVPQKAALAQVSSALTTAMTVDVTNQNALNIAMSEITNSVTCINSRYNTATNITMGTDKRHLIRKLTINTKTRFLAYEKFNAAMSGKTFKLPQGAGCVN
jgi:hypothetical protein